MDVLNIKVVNLGSNLLEEVTDISDINILECVASTVKLTGEAIVVIIAGIVIALIKVSGDLTVRISFRYSVEIDIISHEVNVISDPVVFIKSV